MTNNDISIINALIKKPCNEDGVIQVVKKSMNIEEAVEKAFASKDEHGKIVAHQRRVGRKVLDDALREFKKKLFSQLGNCQNFDDIYNLVDKLPVPKFGKLAKYDVALRISFYFKEKLNKDYLPDKVYLTRHPAIAYRYITGKTALRFIERNQIHPLITNSNLEPWRIEWLLCEFAKCLKS